MKTKVQLLELSHTKLLVISGLIWLAIGTFLLKLGINFVMHGWTFVGFSEEGYSPLFLTLSSFFGGLENSCTLLIALACLIGYVKGNTVIKKAAERSYNRIISLANPTSLFSIYTRANYLIILAMMSLGFVMKFLALSYDIRGFIDTAVGIALIQGAVHFFRFARNQTKG